jgi:putative FmdB family regulatory protein
MEVYGLRWLPSGALTLPGRVDLAVKGSECQPVPGRRPLPTYEYACTACGHRLEAVQSFSDEPLSECPECGSALRKVYGAVGIVLKGSGFYKTDSRAAASANGNGSNGKKSEATSDDSSTTKKESSPSSSSSSDSGSSGGDGSAKKDDSSAKKDAKPAASAAS